jgi:hypothetical protein
LGFGWPHVTCPSSSIHLLHLHNVSSHPQQPREATKKPLHAPQHRHPSTRRVLAFTRLRPSPWPPESRPPNPPWLRRTGRRRLPQRWSSPRTGRRRSKWVSGHVFDDEILAHELAGPTDDLKGLSRAPYYSAIGFALLPRKGWLGYMYPNSFLLLLTLCSR